MLVHIHYKLILRNKFCVIPWPCLFLHLMKCLVIVQINPAVTLFLVFFRQLLLFLVWCSWQNSTRYYVLSRTFENFLHFHNKCRFSKRFCTFYFATQKTLALHNNSTCSQNWRKDNDRTRTSRKDERGNFQMKRILYLCLEYRVCIFPLCFDYSVIALKSSSSVDGRKGI